MGIIGNEKYSAIVNPYIEEYGMRTLCEVDRLPEAQEALDKFLSPLPSTQEFFGFEVEDEEDETESFTLTPAELHKLFERVLVRKMVSEMTRATAQSVVTFLGRNDGSVETRSGVSFNHYDIIRAYSELHPDEDELKEYKHPCLW